MSDLAAKTVSLRFVPVGGALPPSDRNQPSFAHVIFGVVFPAIVIIVEFTWRLCASTVFDPIPTAWHALAVSFVPAMNLIAWARVSHMSAREARWLMLGMGAAVLIAGCYALLFLPLMPIAVIGIVYGLGLLPFGPLAAFLSAIRLFVLGVRSHRAPRLGPIGVAGIGLGLMALVTIDIPMVATRLGVQWAASSEPAKRDYGLTLLRTFGDDDLLLRLCYGVVTRPAGPLGLLMLMAEGHQIGNGFWFEPRQREILTPQVMARELYYRVHGIAFNQAPPPRVTAQQRAFFDDFQFDSDLGGADVGGRVKGLSLTQSRFDGSISGDDVVAYLEWMLEFRNVALVDREARLEIALPPGAVVSRVSLWINGEEKEAAYGGRGEVRAAYQKVAVQQRRDPLLVTTKGADRVLIQAFPVPRNGGIIKFKLGITAPLDVLSGTQQRLVLPAIFDRNFAIGNDVAHNIWIESKQPMSTSGDISVAHLADGLHRVSGRLADLSLTRRRQAISVVRSTTQKARLAQIGTGTAIIQEIKTRTAKPAATQIVIDGSAQLADKTDEIIQALATAPAGARIGISIAAEPVISLPIMPWDEAAMAQARRMLRAHRFAGGQDNATALAAALLALEREPGANLLWIHGPQPQVFEGGAAQLAQTVARLTRLPTLTLYAVVPGPNMLLPDVPWSWSARMLPHVGSLKSDVSDYLRQVATGAEFAIERHELGEASPPVDAIKGSDHIVRLWTRDHVLDMMRNSTTQQRREEVRLAAVAIATDTRIVTPVSGAVVLENKQQYDENSLTPVIASSVPTLPEPHEWALICIAGLAMFWLLGRSRQGLRLVHRCNGVA